MSAGETIGSTIVLVVVAGITAGFWLNLLMWIPMLIFGQLRDQDRAYTLVTATAMATAATAVFLVGQLVLDLPWYAAAIAGLFVGMTSYAQPVS